MVEKAVWHRSQRADDLHESQTTLEQDGAYEPEGTDIPEESDQTKGAGSPDRNSLAMISPSTVQMPITHRLDARQWQCFAPIAHSQMHLQASQLKDLGVWLGSMDNPDEVVTNRSYTQILEDYYKATSRGRKTFDSVEPTSNRGRTSHQESRVACVSCVHSGRQPVEGMMVETHQLRYKKMHRSVSIFSIR